MELSTAARRPTIVFVALQTGAGANGGIASLGEILLSLDRFRPVVLTNRHSASVTKWRDAGIQVVIAEEHASQGVRTAPLQTLATYQRYYRVVRRLLLETGASIAHANDPLAYQLSYAAVLRSRKARMLFSIRDTLDPQRTIPRRRFGWIFRTAAHSFFLSNDMRDRWSIVSPDAARRSSVTGSIVDFSRFQPSPLPVGGAKIILVPGIISPKKGQLHFLRQSAPRLVAAGYELHFSGDDDPAAPGYAQACREVAAGLGDAVRFLGFRGDIPELMRAATVVCVASTHEGLMRSMIEAMAAGRPVVSTDVCSAQEMLRKPGLEAGTVVPVQYGDEMADSLAQLCNDAKLASRYGDNGSRIARDLFTRERVVTAHEDVYARFIGDRAQL